MKKIIIVEDNVDISQVLNKRFTAAGYVTEIFSNGMDLVSRLRKPEGQPEALILDLMIPGRMGHELLNTVKSLWPDVKIFIYSSREEYKERIPQDFIEGFFIKTEGIDKLLLAVEKSLKG